MRILLLFGAMVAAGGAFAQSSDPTIGRHLAASCANCHGTNGISKNEMPTLAGKPADQMVQMMREFRDGKRTATIMHQIAKGYTDEQVAMIAAYFATQRIK